MKTIKYISLVFAVTLSLSSCTDIINQEPVNNVVLEDYLRDNAEVRTGLNGCYRALQNVISYSGESSGIGSEWVFTELRSDNTLMGANASTSSLNYSLDEMDRYIPNTSHRGSLFYWTNSYYVVRSANIILDALGANYDSTSGTISLEAENSIVMTAEERNTAIAEACFLRATQYYNLVRLYGGVFLIDEPITAAEAKQINRSSVSDIYKLIEADLVTASNLGFKSKFTAIPESEVGYANSWAAKTMLAKVYLNLNRKAEAIPLLIDVRDNSGYSLQSSYVNVFSTTNEMNSEILFAVRFKSGQLGLGSAISNDMAPASSGTTYVTGKSYGYNTPTTELYVSYAATDTRRDINIGVTTPSSPVYKTALKYYYVKKYNLVRPTYEDDSDVDWPIVRFSDVLLLLAEAQGNVSTSWDMMDLVHKRACGGVALTRNLTNIGVFETALANERRWEFAFENQRLFDLLRFQTTMSTVNVKTVMDAHFNAMYNTYPSTTAGKGYYAYKYTRPIDLTTLQGNFNTNTYILPIPQYEIDTNSYITIPQNPGY